jgi:1-acyl-sn-glycerol-3-phosphate acyltransferase
MDSVKNLSELRRFIFYFLAAVITIIIAVIFLPVVFFRELNIKLARSWLKIILALLKFICKIDFKIIGKENIPKGSFIVVSKHQSALETLIYPLLFSHPVFVLKKSIFFIPIMGPALKSARAVYIDRSKGTKAILHMQEQLKKLPDGYSPVIFPEGTRTTPGIRTEKYRSGMAMIYETLKYPVVPIALNTGVFWQKTGAMRPGTATIKILPAISFTKSYDRKEFLKFVNEIIESNSIELYKNSLS